VIVSTVASSENVLYTLEALNVCTHKVFREPQDLQQSWLRYTNMHGLSYQHRGSSAMLHKPHNLHHRRSCTRSCGFTCMRDPRDITGCSSLGGDTNVYLT
jgi:hypothetical protein